MKNWLTINEIAGLIDDGPNVDEFGTPDDVGSIAPLASSDYEMPSEDDLNSFTGIANAIAFGSLRNSVQRGLTSEAIITDIVQRSLPEHGSVEMTIDHLSFIPDDNDQFDGARLEVVNNAIIGYNGFDGDQVAYEFTGDQDMLAGFIAVGSYVLPGMVMSLLKHAEE